MRANRWSWHATGAVCGLVGSFLLPLFGSVFFLLESRLARDYPFLETFAHALTLSLFPLLAFGLYCLNVAVERAVPTESGCSRRQLPERVRRGRGLSAARQGSGSVFTNFL